ncbi:archeo-eukaryotice exosomal RNAse PH [Cryptosporidium ryanae]|uniref:archeo-eukaryotice exosomal RNAse PH n=1 Tax=Cryptosporidium ryanae TaxID=515981 RepID=UPI00351A1348|nr:archeo-eukaryotice exosomal RNAse PH [Cryptosporidium ryanae]
MVIFDSFAPLPKIKISEDYPVLVEESIKNSDNMDDCFSIPVTRYIRRDNRQTDEIRPINIRTNVIKAADGSAYVSMGKTKVLCGVYGPNISKQNISDGGLSISVEFVTGSFCREKDSFVSKTKYSRYQNDQQNDIKSNDRLNSILIEKIIHSVVCQNKYRRNKIDCYFYLIEDDGSSFSATIIASCLALCNAQIELIGLYSSIKIIATPLKNIFKKGDCINERTNNKDSNTHSKDKYIMLIDPTSFELNKLNNNYSSLEIGICTVRNQIVYMSAVGSFFSDQSRIEEAFALAEASCSALVNEIKDHMIAEIKNNDNNKICNNVPT